MIGGLLPICFETSLQVQSPIPIALTMVAALATTTVLVLFVLPTILPIGNDARRLATGGLQVCGGRRRT